MSFRARGGLLAGVLLAVTAAVALIDAGGAGAISTDVRIKRACAGREGQNLASCKRRYKRACHRRGGSIHNKRCVIRARPPVPATLSGLHVAGNSLVDAGGSPLRLLGVNRSGTEYACIQGWGIFDGPSDAASIAAMKTWKINSVRVPLNEDCWLGINGAQNGPSGAGGAAYRQAISGYVQRLNDAGLYVILDLHVAAPGTRQSTAILKMPDADHAPDFWHSVAQTFGSNPTVVFDLYNEPHDVSWDCWRNGCTVDDGGSYQAAGMQSLVDAVRATGSTRPLLLGGLQWSNDLTGWLANRPSDPASQLVASLHTYDFAPCLAACRANAVGIRAAGFPVVAGEIGETDCNHDYIDDLMGWADANGVSYLGWTWDAVAPGGWSCTNGPSLILDYNGTPTGFGVGFRDHLLALAG